MKAGVFAAGVAVFLIVAPGAGAGGKAATTVHFTTIISTGSDGSYYEGSIESPKRACANDRKITVFKRTPGSDKVIGSTRSKPRGELGYEWTLEVPEHLKNGTYYAKAPATSNCRGDKSPEVTYRTVPRRA